MVHLKWIFLKISGKTIYHVNINIVIIFYYLLENTERLKHKFDLFVCVNFIYLYFLFALLSSLTESYLYQPDLMIRLQHKSVFTFS